MAENGETPQDHMHERSEIPTLLQRTKTAVSVALSGNYDAKKVTPEAYQAFVEGADNKRSKRAETLTELVTHYIPPFNAEGEPARMLDIAAGTGIVSRALASIGYVVTATDLSHEFLNYLKQKSPIIETRQADMNQGLPFKDSSYDGITTLWGNRYIKDTDVFLREMHRVLKQGGKLVWPIFPIERPVWKMRNGIKQHTTAKSLMNDALAAGFQDVEIVETPLVEALKKGIFIHSNPQYVIARK